MSTTPATETTINVNAINQDEMLEQYLTFATDGEEYGIEIRYVKDIIQIPEQPITPMPFLADYIRGIINLRGTIVPVVDIRMRFSRPPHEYNERTCIIVVELDEIQIGMIVDAVREVLTIPAGSLAKPPQMSRAGENKYVNSIASLNDDQEIVLLVDIHKLFYDGEILPDAVML